MDVKSNLQNAQSSARFDSARNNLRNSVSPQVLKGFEESVQKILTRINNFQSSYSGFERPASFAPTKAPSQPAPTGDGPGKAVVVGAADGDRQDVSRTINANLAGTGQAAPATPEAGDGLRFSNGAAPDGTVTATGTIVNNAELTSESNQGPVAGLRFTNGTGFEGTLINNNTISGANNGLYFGDSKNDATVVNNGTISSDSRAVNIDGTGIDFTNNAKVIGTGNQRDGTIYTDSTADLFKITNGDLIDAGFGNEGAGVSLQNGSADGDIVNGYILNNGTIQGRGQAAANTPGAGDGIRVANSGADGGTTVFQGDIVNNGTLDSESNQGPTAGLRFTNGAALDGTVTNNGTISGANNGLYFGDTKNPNANAVNNGTISSDSRAVNIDGTNVNLTNNGQILGTGNQRDGTIYTDATADDFSIVNNGLVDAGKGNEGAGISLQNGSEDGDVVNGSIVNNGLVQGRGKAGAATPGAGDGLRVANSGADGGTTVFQGDIVNNGTLDSKSNQGPTAGLRFTNGAALDGTVTNNGTISGANNGLYFGDTKNPNANAVNNGTISSDSRAVNVDGTNVNVTNNGSILGTGDQRNGTFYADSTADEYSLTNNGRIDAGRGNNGSGVSLQTGDKTGDVVNANIENNGRIIGRGDAVEGNGVGDGVRLFSDEKNATFKGDIVNNSGGRIIGARGNDAAVGISVEDGITLDGKIVNDGRIKADDTAIDTTEAGGDINIVNNGRIKGDIKLGAGNDTLDSSNGAIRGDIDAGAGNDTISLGRGRNTVTTGEGHDTIAVNRGSGRDTVTDFTLGKDTIDVSSTGVKSFDELRISQRGNDALVRTGAGAALTLQNVRAADLSASNFNFAH